MNILLTNDDGYRAEGINALFDYFSSEHNVFMVAPGQERSGCSNAITIHTPLQGKRISERIWALDGFPADCVNFGLHGGIIENIDLVISGINHGPNLGEDIFYSGTVGAARTARIFGKPAIAVSYHSFTDYSRIADCCAFTASLFPLVMSLPKALFNVNYPSCAENDIAGARWTCMGHRRYIDHYECTDNGNGSFSAQLRGKIESDAPEGSDIHAVEHCVISVTPLTLDAVDHEFLEKGQVLQWPVRN